MIDGVHIWRAALDEAGWPGAEQLPPHERERAGSFLHDDACRRWTAARWALRGVLAGYLDERAGEIELEAGEHGKPRLQGGEGFEFNLSHSGGLALVAVTEGREVGVDLELEDPRRDLVALAERALEPEAIEAVRAATPRQRPAVFYPAWVRHEARLKCLGVGLGGHPPGDRSALAIAELDVAPGYAAAVAVAASEVGRIECRSLRAG